MKHIELRLYPSSLEAKRDFEKYRSIVKSPLNVRVSDLIETTDRTIRFVCAYNPNILKGYEYDSVWVDKRIDQSVMVNLTMSLEQLIESRRRVHGKVEFVSF